MNYAIADKNALRALIEAARNIQNLMDDGTIPAAFYLGSDEQIHTAVSAFDHLTQCAARVSAQDKPVSPFARYRREILGEYETAGRLRDLVLALYTDTHVDLSTLLSEADDHHVRIALECMASFSKEKIDGDSFFLRLADEVEVFETIKYGAKSPNRLMGDAA